MKRVLITILIIAGVLLVVDAITSKSGLIETTEQVDRYKKIKNSDKLPIGLKENQLAPNFTVKNLEGDIVSLQDYRGKKVILNFWASWCPPCKKEMPYMEKLYEKYSKDGYVILALNMTSTETDLEVVQSYVKDKQLSFPILLDETGEVSRLYEILAYPTSYFIDSEGVVRSRVTGALDEEYMYKEMIRLP